MSFGFLLALDSLFKIMDLYKSPHMKSPYIRVYVGFLSHYLTFLMHSLTHGNAVFAMKYGLRNFSIYNVIRDIQRVRFERIVASLLASIFINTAGIVVHRFAFYKLFCCIDLHATR